jgi:hypothetical protein
LSLAIGQTVHLVSGHWSDCSSCLWPLLRLFILSLAIGQTVHLVSGHWSDCSSCLWPLVGLPLVGTFGCHSMKTTCRLSSHFYPGSYSLQKIVSSHSIILTPSVLVSLSLCLSLSFPSYPLSSSPIFRTFIFISFSF